MIKLIKEIRKQPEHVRHIFMWTSVVITFVLVGTIWLSQTKKQLVAMLNDETVTSPASDNTQLAKADSPFKSIGNSISEFGASIYGLVSGNDNSGRSKFDPVFSPVPPQKFP